MARRCADGAIIGARIYTLDEQRPIAEALCWRDGVILAVGTHSDIRPLCDSQTKVIDGSGTCVTPGLTDGHAHPFFIEQTRGINLVDCQTVEELGQTLVTHMENHTDEEWLLGWGVEYGVFRGAKLHYSMLPKATLSKPMFLSFMDQHTFLANKLALQMAGIQPGVRFDDNSEIVVDKSGALTGELRELGAGQLIKSAIPEMSASELHRGAIDNLEAFNRVGLAGTHIMDGEPSGFEFLRRLEEEGDLTLRVVYPLWQEPGGDLDEMRSELRFVAERGRRWRGGLAKFYIDGVIDSGTAWLYEPDRLGSESGPFWPDPDDYVRAVGLFSEAGFQCATHAVGDRAVGVALDAYAQASKPATGLHRVEHIETLDASDLGRFSATGPAASLQPSHMQWRRRDGTDSYASRLGPARTRRGFPVKAILNRGAPIALGSDWPVASFDPRFGMAWARLRRTPGRPDVPPFEPEQRLSGLEALLGYTRGPALIAGDRNGGSLVAGKLADITMFGDDPVLISGDELPNLPVVSTIVDGDVVFRTDQ